MPTKILAKTYGDSRHEARIVFLIAVEHAGKEAPDEAIALTKELLSNDQLCGRALLSLSSLGRATEIPLEFLLQALHRDVPKWIVLDTLAQFRAKVPLDPLLPFLGDRNKAVSAAAARAIAKTHPATIQSFLLPQIEAILQGEPTGEIFAASIQRRIAYRIGWMDHVPPPLLNMLIELLDYPYEQVKLEAIYALGKIHQPIPEPALHRIAQLRANSQSQAIHQAADEVLAQSGAR
jgi:HEAT repeat protein